jgi:hypothetical protein
MRYNRGLKTQRYKKYSHYSEEVKKFEHMTIWARRVQNMWPKSTWFGAEKKKKKHNLGSNKTQNLRPKNAEFGGEFRAAIFTFSAQGDNELVQLLREKEIHSTQKSTSPVSSP